MAAHMASSSSRLADKLVHYAVVHGGADPLKFVIAQSLFQFFLLGGEYPEPFKHEIGVVRIPAMLLDSPGNQVVLGCTRVGQNTAAPCIVQIFRIDIIGAVEIEQESI